MMSHPTGSLTAEPSGSLDAKALAMILWEGAHKHSFLTSFSAPTPRLSQVSHNADASFLHIATSQRNVAACAAHLSFDSSFSPSPSRRRRWDCSG